MSEPTFNKARYDLAIEYAKISLQKAIADRSIYGDPAPDHINELEYLMSEFCMAYSYYMNCVDNGQMNNLSSYE